MAMLHEAWVGDNLSAPTTAHNFGPFTTAGGVARLIRVRAVAGFSFPGEVLAPTASLFDIMAWGVQAYITGYTPLVLPADIGGYTFLWSELAASNAYASIGWVPGSGDVGNMGSTVAYREWRGQIPVGPAVDLYLTYGATIAGAPDFACTWSMEVDYSY